MKGDKIPSEISTLISTLLDSGEFLLLNISILCDSELDSKSIAERRAGSSPAWSTRRSPPPERFDRTEPYAENRHSHA